MNRCAECGVVAHADGSGGLIVLRHEAACPQVTRRMFAHDLDHLDLADLPPEQREAWEQMLAQRKLGDETLRSLAAHGEVDKVLSLLGSEDRAAWLVSYDRLRPFTPPQLRRLLGEWWSISEAWSADETGQGMIALLRRAGFMEVGGTLPPGQVFTVYRGNLGERPASGWSWSLKRETAELFANMAMSARGMFLGMYREGGVPTIWKALVNRKSVLGYFDDRDEAEVVVDPSGLYVVKKIAEAR